MLLSIAWRNVWRSPIRSLVIIVAVTLGLWAGIFIIAFQFGMAEGRMKIAIENEVSHLQIHHAKFKADNEARFTLSDSLLLSKIQAMPEVKSATTRSIARGMLATTSGSVGMTINGIDPTLENATINLKSAIINSKDSLGNGGYFESNKKNPILVSKKLAKKQKLRIGSKVVLTFQDKENATISGAFRVEGIFRTANAPFDETHVYVKKTDLDTLLGLHNDAHELAILLKNVKDLAAVKAKLTPQYPNLLIEDWKELSPQTALVYSALDTWSIILSVIIMLALAFGIVNTMLMAILERTSELGVLMALGMNKKRLFAMILMETVLLVGVGVPFGLLLGWSVNTFFATHGIDVTFWGEEVFENLGYAKKVYTYFPPDQYLQMTLLVIATAFVSAIYPAYKALKLRPVEAIRK